MFDLFQRNSINKFETHSQQNTVVRKTGVFVVKFQVVIHIITIYSTVHKVLLYFIEMILEIFYFSSDEGAREIIFREVIEMK